MVEELIDARTAITWFCATLADLHCDMGGHYECFCEPDDKPEQKMVSKKMVDFALMAVRDIAWKLRKDSDFVIPAALLDAYMKEHAEFWQEEYK